MKTFSYTLLTDGSSDEALSYVIDWLLREHTEHPFRKQWADLRGLPEPPKGLKRRIAVALEYYPCDILFVHRDAENETLDRRVKEIRASVPKTFEPVVCVVPVRMQETWWLFDEVAIRRAASNPNGTQPLGLPTLKRLEQLPKAKEALYEILRKASGLPRHRLGSFSPARSAHRTASLIQDFSPLRALSAFAALERELTRVLKTQRLAKSATA